MAEEDQDTNDTDRPRAKPHVSRKAARHKATPKSEATRQQILDAAAALFARQGYSLTKLSDIAKDAGIHLTGLYYYFDNKEELVSDIIRQAPARAASDLKQALSGLPADATYRQKLEVAFTAYLRSILRDDDYVRADHRIAKQVSPEIRAQALEISREINEVWRDLLTGAIEAGEVRDDIDPTLLRMLMIGGMNWSVEWFRPKLGSPEKLAQAMARLFFEGALPGTTR